MAPKRKNVVGLQFGRIKVLEDLGMQGYDYKYRCECSTCGKIRIIAASNLKDASCMQCARLEKYGSLEERLLKNSIPEPNSGCWLWLGGLQHYDKQASYGGLSFQGKSIAAHRASFEVFKHPVPAGKEVCHSCDNPFCINPEHLFVGTHLENMQDRDKKKRRTAVKGEKNNLAKLTAEQVLEIRVLLEKGIPQQKIAEQFNIVQTAVSLIKNRHNWGHI
jgi:hypothetical protein